MLGHMGFGGIWMLLSSVALVLLVLWLVRALFPDFSREDGDAGADASMNVLRERFARGEIGADEFEERRTVLQGGRRA